MNLREKVAELQTQCAFDTFTAAEKKELLEALELAEAVKWIEENNAHLSYAKGHARVTARNAMKIGPDADQLAPTIPEAVQNLKAALEPKGEEK